VRILFVSGEYPPVTDGIGAYVAGVAPALAARGHEVHVLSCVAGQARADELDRGVRVHRRPLRTLPATARLPWVIQGRLRTAFSCRVEARRLPGRFDVVEVPDFLAEGLAFGVARPPALVAHLHTPIGLVTTTSELPVGQAVIAADALERLSVRRAHLVTSPSALLVERLRATGWLGERDVSVVRYPVDAGRWSGVAPVAGSGPVVLAVGRLERRKAPEVLLEACAALAGEVAGLELVFVGRSEEERDGIPYAQWLAQHAADAGVACRCVEHVPYHELADWYGRARVVALPSRFDNFPMVGLEALASGRPFVCTDATGTAEILAGTGAGAVVPVGDAAALGRALRPYLLDAEAAARAGAEARRLVTEACAPERIARERERLYAEAVRLRP
jgi:glycosyltransferase involved in cell wall biosynthesis